MRLGIRIKELRQAKELSQPELAEKIGIERSYLSKLENDKSVPSNETFSALLSAFGISIGEFLSGKDWSAEQARLRQIPDVEYWFKVKEQAQFDSQRRYLFGRSALIVMAVTLFYVGMSKPLFSEVRYQYESRGIILLEESKLVFRNWQELIDRTCNEGNIEYEKKRLEMSGRYDEEILSFSEKRGDHFYIRIGIIKSPMSPEESTPGCRSWVSYCLEPALWG